MGVLTYSAAFLFRNFPLGQYSRAGFQRFRMSTRPKGQNRKFIEQSIVEDPCFDEKPGRRAALVKKLLRELVSLIVAAPVSTEASGAMDRFDARRTDVMRPEVSFNDVFFRVIQSLLESCRGVQTVEDFLVPEAVLRTFQVIFNCEFGLTRITVALRQIESVSRVEKRVSLDGERSFKKNRVFLIFQSVLATRTVLDIPYLKSLGETPRAAFVAFTKFMKHPAINQLDFVAGQLGQ